ncbi:MAG TPA: cellulase family glycosylhydrolase [Capsulimonadaceae bacterium]|jgi:hypothetical protein
MGFRIPHLIAALAFSAILLLVVAPLSFAAAAPVSVPSWAGSQGTTGWKFSDPAAIKVESDSTQRSVLTVSSASSTMPAGAQVAASIALPLAEVRGTHVEITTDIRAGGVTKPAHSYNGIKAMLHVASPTTSDNWDQANANQGDFPLSYDWKTFTFRTTVPADASTATLILGLQESAGTVSFRNLKVVVLRKISTYPSAPPPGPLYTGHSPGALRGMMIDPLMKADDIETLKKWNVNLVRYQLMWGGFPFSKADSATPAEYDAWLDGLLAHVDELMPVFKKAGILVLLDLHTPPGGREKTKGHRIFTDAAWQAQFVSTWERIAKRYRNEKQIWGYDLVNEPILGPSVPGVDDWHDLAQKTAQRIRAIDPNHMIMVEPDPGGSVSSLAHFEPIKLPGVVYSVHMYDPGQFTHQGVLEGLPVGPIYPDEVGGKKWDKEQIRRDFKPVLDYSKAYNVAIYIGEFSAVRWAKGADQYLKDVTSVMEEYNWDWSYHAFREWQGWSLEVGDDKDITTLSATPTARLQVMQAALAPNKPLTIVEPPRAEAQQSELPVSVAPTIAKDGNGFHILFIGNSITRHGSSPDTIARLKWDHVAGMAASMESKDFVHLLTAKIAEALPKKKVDIQITSIVPGGLGTPEERLVGVIKDTTASSPDLVIFQHGEHEHSELGAEAVAGTYNATLDYLAKMPSKPRIVCVGNWSPGATPEKPNYTGWAAILEDTMHDICNARSIPFVSVASAAADPACHGTGDHPGVKWHPNDAGHARYAELIFDKVKPLLSLWSR